MVPNKWCSDILDERYATRMDAEVACDKMQQSYGNCTTIYDYKCDGDYYSICKDGSQLKPTTGQSCIYLRAGSTFTVYIYYFQVLLSMPRVTFNENYHLYF